MSKAVEGRTQKMNKGKDYRPFIFSLILFLGFFYSNVRNLICLVEYIKKPCAGCNWQMCF